MKHYKYIYLCIPQTIQRRENPIYDDIVALDPGKRTFQTFYSPKIAGEMGKDPHKKFVKTQ